MRVDQRTGPMCSSLGHRDNYHRNIPARSRGYRKLDWYSTLIRGRALFAWVKNGQAFAAVSRASARGSRPDSVVVFCIPSPSSIS